MAIELLQRFGLNQYEADAYATLLAEGPLTGYELGKRSGVPLSRSYEVVERLAQKGLALVQPGDPSRYAASPAEQFLAQTRSETLATLDALAASLTELPRPEPDDGFWVVRGRAPILARAAALIAEAQQSVAASLPAAAAALGEVLDAARQRGCRCRQVSPGEADTAPAQRLLLLADERLALAGTLSPAPRCQAVISSNPGLVAAVAGYFVRPSQDVASRPDSGTVPVPPTSPLDWVAWEDRKQRHVWRAVRGDRVA